MCLRRVHQWLVQLTTTASLMLQMRLRYCEARLKLFEVQLALSDELATTKREQGMWDEREACRLLLKWCAALPQARGSVH